MLARNGLWTAEKQRNTGQNPPRDQDENTVNERKSRMEEEIEEDEGE